MAFGSISPAIPDTWAEAQAVFPMPIVVPPAYSSAPVAMPTFVPPLGCREPWRGLVALPDGRAVAVPYCSPSFVVLDPAMGSSMPVPPMIPYPGGGRFSGGVLGCDLRVYAFPQTNGQQLARLTVQPGGAVTLDWLQLWPPAPYSFNGGVIARPCRAGFRVIAAGNGALFAIDIFNERAIVTPIPVPNVGGVSFTGVARLGDSTAVAIQQDSSGAVVHAVVDSNSLSVLDYRLGNAAGERLGVATLRSGRIVSTDATGTLAYFALDGGNDSVNQDNERARWPVNLLTGWVAAAGRDITAYPELQGGSGTALQAPATESDAGLSGGLLLLPSGELLNVSAVSPYTATIYIPSQVPTVHTGLVLSPWFNKL